MNGKLVIPVIFSMFICMAMLDSTEADCKYKNAKVKEAPFKTVKFSGGSRVVTSSYCLGVCVKYCKGSSWAGCVSLTTYRDLGMLRTDCYCNGYNKKVTAEADSKYYSLICE